MSLLATILLMFISFGTYFAKDNPSSTSVCALDIWILSTFFSVIDYPLKILPFLPVCIFFGALALFEYALLLALRFRFGINTGQPGDPTKASIYHY